MKRAWWVGVVPLLLMGCPDTGPDARTADNCVEFASCGVCVSQPQCGWCMQDGEGVCIPNRGEDQPREAPPSCGEGRSWHTRIADDPALPEEAPYCPREVAEEGQ